MYDSTGYSESYFNYFIMNGGYENQGFRNNINRDKTSFSQNDHLNYIISYKTDEYALHPNPILKENNNWVTAMLIISFTLIALSKGIFQRKFNLIIRALYNNRNFNALIKEVNIFNEFQSWLLFVAYVLNFSLFIYFLIRFYAGRLPSGYGFYDYGEILIFFFIFNLMKLLIIRVIGAIFKTSAKSNEYMALNFIFSLVAGMFIFPLLVLIFYSNMIFILYTSLIIISLYYLFQLYKDFFIGSGVIKFSKVYLFIYLCTLEILPVMILIKLFLINLK